MRIYDPTIKSKAPLMAFYGLVFVLFFLFAPKMAMAASPDIYTFSGHANTISTTNVNFSNPDLGAYTSLTSITLNSSSTPYGDVYARDSTNVYGTFGAGYEVSLFEGTSPGATTQCGFWTLNAAQNAQVGLGMTLVNLDASQWTYSADCTYSATADLYLGLYSASGLASFTTLGTTGVSAYADVSSAPFFATNTRIDTIDPANNATTTSAVPVTFGATGYVNGDDYNKDPSNTFVRWAFSPQSLANSTCADVICAFNGANGNSLSNANTYSAQITASGVFNVSTTSSSTLPDGYYNLTVSLVQPSSAFSINGILGWLGYSAGLNTLVSTTTSFAVGSTSAYQDLLHNTLGYTSNTSTSTQALLDSCSPLSGSFSIGLCTSLLFLPNSGDLQQVFNLAENTLLTKMPWGYVNRVVNIFTASTSPTSLPSFTATVALGPTSSTSISFDPGDMLAGGATLLGGITDPNSGLNDRQIFEPWIQLFIALTVIIIIFHDVMGMGVYKKGQHR